MRYPLFLVFLNHIYYLFSGGDLNINLISALISGILVFLLYIYRTVKYDDRNVYFISGRKKTIIPFESFTELKRSKSKINNNRFWILKYKDEDGKIKTRRFFHGVFQDSPKAFHEAIHKIRPLPIKWTTNYSQMVDSWNETKAKKRREKEEKQRKKKDEV